MTQCEVSLVLTGLAPVISQEINRSLLPDSLQTLCFKAQFTAIDSRLERLLLTMFSQRPLQQSDLPFVDLWDLGKGHIKADPCYLHADRDKLVLFADNLALTHDEAEAFIAEIQPLLTDFGMTLRQQTQENWYIETESNTEINFTALPDVKQKNIDSFLPEGHDRTFWLKLWNEIQMLLHNSPLNQQRLAANKLPINSLWFWGQGQLESKHNAFTHVYGDNTLLSQLAIKSTCHYHADNTLNTDFNQQTGKALYLLEALDLEANIEAQLQQLEKRYFAPLLKAINKRQVSKVSLYIPEFGYYQLAAKPKWKFW